MVMYVYINAAAVAAATNSNAALLLDRDAVVECADFVKSEKIRTFCFSVIQLLPWL